MEDLPDCDALLWPFGLSSVSNLMDVFDVDAAAGSIVLQYDLLKEHERPLVLCMLSDLQQGSAAQGSGIDR